MKVKLMPNKDHDRTSLSLLKAIAKKLAPVQTVENAAIDFDNFESDRGRF